jgi:hypothetical protein
MGIPRTVGIFTPEMFGVSARAFRQRDWREVVTKAEDSSI